MEDLAESGGDRTHLRPRNAFGDLGDAQPFVDHLAGEVDVRAVGEDDDHLRDAELGDRAQLLKMRQAVDGLLDGKGDLPFDFLGREPGAMVLICTCTGVVSGKASMSSCDSDQAPSTMKTTRRPRRGSDFAATSR